MKSLDFFSRWEANFQHVPPLAWKLREQFKDQWLRLYSLPNGKRYPDTPEEVYTILYRFNAIMNEIVCQTDIEVVLMIPIPSEMEGSRYKPAEVPDFGMYDSFKISIQDEGSYDEEWVILKKMFYWKPNTLDEIVRRVADDKILCPIIVIDNKSIISPYDGGTDLITPDEDRLRSIRSKFADWTSNLSSGL